jgi:hypothetical protein
MNWGRRFLQNGNKPAVDYPWGWFKIGLVTPELVSIFFNRIIG